LGRVGGPGPSANGVLALTLADVLRGEVAVLDTMRGSVFGGARTSESFAKVEVDAETGTVA
jgi:hypothetical protein